MLAPDVNPQTIAAAASEMLRNEGFTVEAKRMAGIIASYPGARGAADALASLATVRARSR